MGSKLCKLDVYQSRKANEHHEKKDFKEEKVNKNGLYGMERDGSDGNSSDDDEYMSCQSDLSTKGTYTDQENGHVTSEPQRGKESNFNDSLGNKQEDTNNREKREGINTKTTVCEQVSYPVEETFYAANKSKQVVLDSSDEPLVRSLRHTHVGIHPTDLHSEDLGKNALDLTCLLSVFQLIKEYVEVKIKQKIWDESDIQVLDHLSNWSKTKDKVANQFENSGSGFSCYNCSHCLQLSSLCKETIGVLPSNTRLLEHSSTDTSIRNLKEQNHIHEDHIDDLKEDLDLPDPDHANQTRPKQVSGIESDSKQDSSSMSEFIESCTGYPDTSDLSTGNINRTTSLYSTSSVVAFDENDTERKVPIDKESLSKNFLFSVNGFFNRDKAIDYICTLDDQTEKRRAIQELVSALESDRQIVNAANDNVTEKSVKTGEHGISSRNHADMSCQTDTADNKACQTDTYPPATKLELIEKEKESQFETEDEHLKSSSITPDRDGVFENEKNRPIVVSKPTVVLHVASETKESSNEESGLLMVTVLIVYFTMISLLSCLFQRETDRQEQLDENIVTECLSHHDEGYVSGTINSASIHVQLNNKCVTNDTKPATVVEECTTHENTNDTESGYFCTSKSSESFKNGHDCCENIAEKKEHETDTEAECGKETEDNVEDSTNDDSLRKDAPNVDEDNFKVIEHTFNENGVNSNTSSATALDCEMDASQEEFSHEFEPSRQEITYRDTSNKDTGISETIVNSNNEENSLGCTRDLVTNEQEIENTKDATSPVLHGLPNNMKSELMDDTSKAVQTGEDNYRTVDECRIEQNGLHDKPINTEITASLIEKDFIKIHANESQSNRSRRKKKKLEKRSNRNRACASHAMSAETSDKSDSSLECSESYPSSAVFSTTSDEGHRKELRSTLHHALLTKMSNRNGQGRHKHGKLRKPRLEAQVPYTKNNISSENVLNKRLTGNRYDNLDDVRRELHESMEDSRIFLEFESLLDLSMSLYKSTRRSIESLKHMKSQRKTKDYRNKRNKEIIKNNIATERRMLLKTLLELFFVEQRLKETSKAITRGWSYFRPGSFELITFPGLESYFQRLLSGPPPSLEEQVVYEWFRFTSFGNSYTGNGSALVLARNGFYHETARGATATRCFACGVRHSTWNDLDDVEAIHRRLSPDCPHVNQNDATSGNVSITPRDAPESRPYMSATAANATVSRTEATAASSAEGAEGGAADVSASGLESQASSVNAAIGSNETLSLQPTEDAENINFRPNLVPTRAGELPKFSSSRNNLATGARTNETAFIAQGQRPASTSSMTVTASTTNATNTGISATLGRPVSAGAFAGGTPVTNPVTSGTTTTTTASQPSTPAVSSGPTPNQGTGGTPTPGLNNPALVVVQSPKHPEYADLDRRTESFQGWPSYLDQTGRQMAEAGFFYAGVADFTRCYCCGGGLRNWEPGDDPVLEHTRWYSTCEYVKQLKGERYVQAVIRRQQQHLEERQRQQRLQEQRREAGRQQDQQNPDPMTSPAASVLLEMGYSNERVREAILAVRRQTGHITILAEQALSWILDEEERTRTEPGQGTETTTATTTTTTTTAVSSQVPPTTSSTPTTTASTPATAMNTTAVTSTSTPAVSTSASSNTSAGSAASTTAVAGSLQGAEGGADRGETPADEDKNASTSQSQSSNGKKKSRGKKTKSGSAKTGATALIGASETGELDTQSLKEENEKLREMQTCKICMERPVNTTFLPCGHLVCCDQCAPRLNKCPICRVRIKGTVKTFMS